MVLPGKKFERYREIFGLTPASVELIVAVLSCESALGRHPTRKECAAIIGIRAACATELLGQGYLDISAKRKLNAPLIATRRAWREFGFAASRRPAQQTEASP